MQIHLNPHAPVQQARQIFIQVSPAKAWAVLTNINQWPQWNPKITQSELQDKLAVGARFRWKVNGTRIHSVLHTVEPAQQFGWSGKAFGASAIHNWYLESKDGGTLVRVEESMQGWLVNLFKRKMNQDLVRDIQLWLERLKTESEK